MAGFFSIEKGDWAVKGLIASVVMVIVGGILVALDFTRTDTGGMGEVVLKCTTPNCPYTAVLGRKEFNAMGKARDKEYQEEYAKKNPGQSPQGPMTMPGMPGMPPGMMMPPGMEDMPMYPWGSPGWPLKCPKCGKDSVLRAIQCEKCKNIFFEDPEATYVDKCPKCGYSAVEEAMKERQAEQAKPKKR
jgi:hypothetical protein